MEYRGIEFTIRARPGRDQWTYTILPQGDAPIIAAFSGTREGAIARARLSIDRFVAKRRLQQKNPSRSIRRMRGDGALTRDSKWKGDGPDPGGVWGDVGSGPGSLGKSRHELPQCAIGAHR